MVRKESKIIRRSWTLEAKLLLFSCFSFSFPRKLGSIVKIPEKYKLKNKRYKIRYCTMTQVTNHVKFTIAILKCIQFDGVLTGKISKINFPCYFGSNPLAFVGLRGAEKTDRIIVSRCPCMWSSTRYNEYISKGRKQFSCHARYPKHLL